LVKRLCIIIIILFSISLFYKDILRGYASLFIVDTAHKGADAILVLGGNSRVRVPYAIELLKKGYAKNILLTDPRPQQIKYKFIQSEQDIARLILKSEGVKYGIVKSQKIGGATSTLEEAYDFAHFLEKYKLERVIIVTSSFHTRRALYTFQKVLSSKDIQTKIEVSPAFNYRYRVSYWWESEQGLLDFIPEFFKMVIYIFSLWNL